MNSMIRAGWALALVAPAMGVCAETESTPLAALEARLGVLEAQAAETAALLTEARAEIERLRGEVEGVASDSTDSPRADIAARADVGAGAGSGNEFNPAISVILNGEYVSRSEGEDGFSLGESEISLSSSIDEKFYGQITLAVESEDGEDGIGIEEAYIDTTALPGGFTVRAGRFFSNIGYLNNHHAHTDKFPDRPLSYQAFFGGHYGDDGVQVRWVAPTDVYLELGGEVLKGSAADGVGATSLFAHAGGDVGFEHSWLAGVSMLSRDIENDEDGFSGDSDLLLADFTWKWAPDGNPQDGGVQLRTEWFFEDRDGVYVDPDAPAVAEAWDGTRRGAYAEAVYRINRQWEAGYRYDRLWDNDEGPLASEFDPSRHGVMLAWRNSEFSLLRLLLSRERLTADDNDNVLLLQYQAAFGAHGSHKF